MARYTFYDPYTKPRVTACSPAYGNYEYQTDVTIRGTNFAPTGSGLKARWGPLGVTDATFISSTALKARTPLPPAHVESLSVPVEATDTGSFSGAPPAADDTLRASRTVLFTYFDPQAPPTIEVSSPVSGPCGVGGAHVPSSYPGDAISQIEVTPSDELMISLHGTNYAPTPMLTCVYRYYVEQLLDSFGYHSTNDQHQEYWVPAVFENAGYVRCPVPTRRFADPAAGALLSSTMPISVTNDGMIYHYSNHAYEQLGCAPIPEHRTSPSPSPDSNPDQMRAHPGGLHARRARRAARARRRLLRGRRVQVRAAEQEPLAAQAAEADRPAAQNGGNL